MESVGFCLAIQEEIQRVADNGVGCNFLESSKWLKVSRFG